MTAPRTTPRAAAALAEFNVIAELGDVADAALLPDDAWTDPVMDALLPYGPAISRSHYGRPEVIFTLPATDLSQAIRTAMALLADVHRPDGSPIPAFSVEVLPTPAFDHRARHVHVPPLLSVPEAAAALGISRQAVLKRIEAGSLPASRVGSVWAIAAAAMPFPLDDDWPHGDHGTGASPTTDRQNEAPSEASEATAAAPAGTSA